MSTRGQPFSGAGRLGADAVRKLNSAIDRAEVYGGNSTSPVTRTPHGTIMQARKRQYQAAAEMPTFDGTAWINGWFISELNTDPESDWIQIDQSVNPWTATEVAGPPSNPWGDNVSYRKKSQIYGTLFFP